MLRYLSGLGSPKFTLKWACLGSPVPMTNNPVIRVYLPFCKREVCISMS